MVALEHRIPLDESESKCPIVQITHLNHHFGEGESRKQVLFDINLEIGPGELVIMTGPSGSGKTTLLTLIGALRSTQEGRNRILGLELQHLSRKELVRVRQQIGFIFQLHNLFDSLSALENVKIAMELSPYSATDMKRLATDMLCKLGLGDRIHYKPRVLSGGQRQRVAIARALINHPKLILADEPTAALDQESSRDVVDWLKVLTRDEGCTILMVTHDSRILDVADRIVNMVDGHIESDVQVHDAVRICEFLTKSQTFSTLSPTELLNIAERVKKENYPADSMIIRQGDPGDKFYIVESGEVDVRAHADSEGRDTQIVNHLGEGEFFGERALITGEPRNASVVSVQNVTVYSLDKADFQAALDASESFKEQLLKIAFQR